MLLLLIRLEPEITIVKPKPNKTKSDDESV